MQLIIDTKKLDIVPFDKKVGTVDIDTVKHRNIRETHAEWIVYHTGKKLQLTQLLLPQGWSQEQVQLAATQIISGALYLASELKATRWIRENPAVCEATGYDMEKLTKDKFKAH